VAFVQPAYRGRAVNGRSLVRVATLVGDTGRGLAPAMSMPAAAAEPRTAPAGPPKTAAQLYDDMREALRRGDWTAFGRAFDALGRALEHGRKP
jgi:uncharacterized membrane protein (UPF0182 family)